MRIRISIIPLLVFALVPPTAARAVEDGGTRSVFAEGAGNRALGMGGAYVALASDASAPIWNPAGLGWMTRGQIQATHTSLYGLGLGEQFLGLAWPDWRFGVGAATLRHFGADGIEGRDDRNVLTDADLSDAETEIALSYGRALGQAWSVGGSLKLQRQSVAGASGSGIGVDLGILVNPGLALARPEAWLERTTIGLSVRNIVEPSVRLDQESVSDPRVYRLGFGYTHPFASGRVIQGALDFERSPGMSTRVHAGLEFRVHPMLAIRTGLNQGDLAAGAGFSWRDYALEYAFEENDLGNVHRVGLNWTFGATVDEQRLSALKEQETVLRARLAEEFATREQERVTQLLASAKTAGGEGRYEDALEAVAVAATLAPDNILIREREVEILLLKGKAEERDQLFAEAAITYGRALTVDPKNKDAQEGHARCRSESDLRAARFGELRQRFGQALDAFTAGRLPEARDSFRAILDDEPNDTDARTMLQRTEEAIARRAGDLVADAERLVEGGAFAEADSAINQAQAFDASTPGLEAATRHLTDARRRAAEEARRAARAREEAADSPTPTTGSAPPAPGRPVLTAQARREMEDLYRKGTGALQDGRSVDALRYFELVYAMDPQYLEVKEHLKHEYLMQGMDAFATGRLDDAVRLWENALKIDPKDEKARGYLSRAQEQRTRTREILGKSGGSR